MIERTVPRPNWQQTFAAFKYRNYRLWFGGQLFSLFGTWMQTTAQGFLVYQLTNSPAYLGYVAFASGLPTWLFTLYGGVIADRMSRRTLMVVTQSAMLVLAFILAALTFTGLVQPWHIVVLAFLLGIANAFDAPARQAFVLEMVEREDLTNAIALNATMFNAATAVGPAVAGVTYAAFGPAWCFTLNGVSFIAIIVALLMMRIRPQAARARRVSAASDLMEGLRYVVAQPVIRALIGLVGVLSLFGVALFTLMPAWAVEVLSGDAATLGWLQSARGAGALIGALLLASLGRFKFKGKLLTAGTILFPLTLLIFALIRQESFFERGARSSAAAQGLTQVIPSTAEEIAGAIGWPNFEPDDIYKPYVNIKFGVYYLWAALNMFDGNPYPALAGYNAGPGNAQYWVDQANTSDDDLFVEEITINEPKIYVRRVLAHFAAYKRLYGDQAADS